MDNKYSKLIIEIDANTKKLDEINNKVDQTKGGIDNIGSSMTSWIKGIGLVAIAYQAVTKVVSSIIGFVKDGVEAFSEYEGVRNELKTMFNGIEIDVQNAWRTMKAFSDNVPFGLENVKKSFKQLKDIGISPTTESLEALGDIAFAKGLEISDLTKKIMEAEQGKLGSFEEYGILMEANGDKMIMKYKGVNREVSKNAKEIQAALIDIRNNDENIKGALANNLQSQYMVQGSVNESIKELKSVIGDKLSPSITSLASTINNYIQNEINKFTAQQQAKAVYDTLKSLKSEISNAQKSDDSTAVDKVFEKYGLTRDTSVDVDTQMQQLEADVLKNLNVILKTGIKDYENDIANIETQQQTDSESVINKLLSLQQDDITNLNRASEEPLVTNFYQGIISDLLAGKFENENVETEISDRVLQAQKLGVGISTGQIYTLIKDFNKNTLDRQLEKEKTENKLKITKDIQDDRIEKMADNTKRLLGLIETESDTITTTSTSTTEDDEPSKSIGGAGISSTQKLITINIDNLLNINELQAFKTDEEMKSKLEDMTISVFEKLLRDTN